jgi:hypothetical protein
MQASLIDFSKDLPAPYPIRAPSEPVGLAFFSAAQLAKTTLFASGNEADVRKSAAGDFFQ